MFARGSWRGVVLTLALGCMGCVQKSDSSQADAQLPAWMTEDSQAAPEIKLASETPSAYLGLNLKPGDQFPLRKVVQQELTQNTVNGAPQQNYSRLELLMAIHVREKLDDRIKLSVRYDRVKYQHHVADEHVEFDSTQPAQTVSPAMAAYRDMVNDGFSFWIGQDNQIVEVEGLGDFISRCLRSVPPAERQNVVLGIEAGSGDTGIANFVDNTIGLLPYGRKTSPGDAWERQQQIARPMPMHVSNVYTLKELTEKYAVIDVRGTITPSTTLNNLQGGEGVRVTVNGGSTLGSCTIFRDTGLPKESRIDRVVEMTVVMANSIQFRQTKRVTTTVESYPMTSSGNPPIAGGANSPVIQQVSGTR
ncbi:DUF6263 family protein [Planctomicrobium piriforme]|uniref:Uncharacterized protein n=1 Tax=Planctomicrobium piriforme TaxID=1576369 RepID=A0A1I3BHB2_9PLAN|nr:DUF6263 family protein [Planctomicrobium piriforme]SFH61111.1 hypothetical protein SAMN05421753_101430 [Planctomicrobium piriforme]